MRDVKAITSTALVLLSLAACEAQDKVLQPDIVELDGSTDPIDGDGAEDGTPNDGDPTPGDGDGDGDGDAQPGDGDGAGDGMVGDGDGAPGDGDGGGGEHVAQDADCDLNGIWIARQNTVSVALLLDQHANNWYFMEIEHDGQDIVVKREFDCGVKVLGGVTTVQLSRPTLEALMGHNSQAGRRGKAYKEGSSCHFEMERFWSVRGANEETFVPSPRNSMDSVATVAARTPIPTESNTAGAEDWENDGKLGSAWQATGAGAGTRNSVQRDWTQYFSDATHQFPAAADWTSNVVVRAQFDAEEQVLAADNSALRTPSSPKGSAQHTLTLQFLGRDRDDPRAKALIKSADVDTCFAVQAALPAQNL